MTIQQSGLLFEQSRGAVQAKRADSPGRLVPCGAGKVSWFPLPWSDFSPDRGVAWEALRPPSLGRQFITSVVNSAGLGGAWVAQLSDRLRLRS